MEKSNDGTDSHVPVLKAMLERYKPAFVMELGIGYYSTPLLAMYNYLGVENDLEWIQKIKNDTWDINIIHHDVSPVQRSDHMFSLTKEQIQSATDFYLSLPVPDISPKLLFVDHYASLRTVAINALRDKFDIIIYHDSEISYYVYDAICRDGFKTIDYPTWPTTTVMIREGM